MSEQLKLDEIQKKGAQKYISKVKLVMVKESADKKPAKVNCPADVAGLNLVKEELAESDREKFICLHLSTKNAILSYEVVSIGTLSSSLVHPRELFKAAILSNSAALILCHNHPSGDPTPSAEDISLTKRLAKAGAILGIDVLDHVILGDGSFSSLKERGLM